MGRLIGISRYNVQLLVLFLAALMGAALAESTPLERDGGVLTVEVELNSTLTVRFVLDSGAAHVNITPAILASLKKNHTLTERDFLPKQSYQLADGSVVRAERVLLRKVSVGGVVVENVVASVGGPDSSLLLGQSFLSRLAKWGVDSKSGTFELTAEPTKPLDILELGSLLIAFERNLKAEALGEKWASRRNEWATLIESASSAGELGEALIALENAVTWESVYQEWRERRAEWIDRCKSAPSRTHLAHLLLEFEHSVTWEAVKAEWKDERDEWLEALAQYL